MIVMPVMPVQIKKRRNAAQNKDANMITVNNFFAHWLKEVDIKRCTDDIRILSINNTIDFYRYSEKMLKHLPPKSLDTIKETLLYDKETIIIPGGRDRRSNMSQTPGDRTVKNLGSRKTNFQWLHWAKIVPQNASEVLCWPRPSEFSRKNWHKIYFHPRKQHEQVFWKQCQSWYYSSHAGCSYYIPWYTLHFLLTNSTGWKFSPYQQRFEVNVGTQTINVNFQGANRQLAWMEISLDYEKSDQHQTIYDS